MTWLTLRDKPAPRHLVAREYPNPFVGPLVDTRCGLTNQVPGAGTAGPLCKRCVLYARAHHIPIPEEKPDENQPLT
jgi:hypothetical protein